jgi:arylsulfatase A-like enzyme
LGQFAVALDKRQPYETDVRVPFFARGPGIPAGSTVASGALVSVDLAPTLLQLSGAWSRDAIEALGMDGQPLAAMLTQAEAPPARDFLVEYFGESVDYCASSLEGAFPARGRSALDGRLCPVRRRARVLLAIAQPRRGVRASADGVNCGLRGNWSFVTPPLWNGTDAWSSVQDHRNNTYACVRSVTPGNGTNAADTQFCAWDSGEEELYDLVQDPWQMHNQAPTMLPARARDLRARLARLRACKGRADCAVAGATEAAQTEYATQ